MTDKPTDPAPDTGLPPGVQRPLTKAEQDAISEEQATITDEWAPEPPKK